MVRQDAFLGLFLNARYLLNLIFIVYDALWGGLLALAAFALSLYVRTSRLLVVGLPALALIVSSYLLPPDLNIAQCLIFSLVIPRSPAVFLAAPLVVLLVLVGALWLPLVRRKDVLL